MDGAQVHGNTNLELAWTVAPVLILVAIGSFVFYKLPGIEDVPARRAGGRVDVTVEGHRYYWNFIVPERRHRGRQPARARSGRRRGSRCRRPTTT